MKEKAKERITYPKLFWLFIFGSLLGVLLEGLFCLFRKGAWETHVVSVWGPFCIIYGLGAAVIYVCAVLLEDKNIALRFTAYAVIATVVEYLCGALLKYGLNMKAWDYNGLFLNIDGLVCLTGALAWGVLGIAFEKFAVPQIDKIALKMNGRGWRTTCACFSVFMAINLSVTAVCIVRWAERNRAIQADNSFEQYIDEKYNDEYMASRFCEWSFIEE